MSSTSLLVEESYYWNYAQHLDFGYIDHPPMVAALIYFSTWLLGSSEFAVRFPVLICWSIAALFSFRLSELMQAGTGIHALFLLSILPFFFLQSLVITPDLPLIACWSATLYYSYRWLHLDEPKSLYKAAIAMGLGLLSKYSIILLVPALLFYIIFESDLRRWMVRKEFYLSGLVCLLIFSPVIYWNSMHGWVSFMFQSSGRLQSAFRFTFHDFLVIVLFFLTPLGLYGCVHLFQHNKQCSVDDLKKRRFIQWLTFFPLLIFGTYSLFHEIKFNWVGSPLLGILPWLASEIKKATRITGWLVTGLGLFLIYVFSIACIASGQPTAAHYALFRKFIDWEQLTMLFYQVALNIEKQTKHEPYFVPLDRYNVASELAFYQHQFFTQNKIKKTYHIMSRHAFGGNSLMYDYWSDRVLPSGQPLMLISNDASEIQHVLDTSRVKALSPLMKVWSGSQGRHAHIKPYYYQIVLNDV